LRKERNEHYSYKNEAFLRAMREGDSAAKWWDCTMLFLTFTISQKIVIDLKQIEYLITIQRFVLSLNGEKII
jgi:hypothetical protein